MIIAQCIIHFHLLLHGKFADLQNSVQHLLVAKLFNFMLATCSTSVGCTKFNLARLRKKARLIINSSFLTALFHHLRGNIPHLPFKFQLQGKISIQESLTPKIQMHNSGHAFY